MSRFELGAALAAHGESRLGLQLALPESEPHEIGLAARVEDVEANFRRTFMLTGKKPPEPILLHQD